MLNERINNDQYIELGQESNYRLRPIIVRSSGVNEDCYGDARAGKYHSEVHGGTDIFRTCLRVLASGVCLEGGPMAIILQECIDCSFGGVVMSYSSLQDNTLQIEYGPGQPKSVVSGEFDIQAHRYAIKRDKSRITGTHFEKGDITVSFGLQKTDHGCGFVEVQQTTPDKIEPGSVQVNSGRAIYDTSDTSDADSPAAKKGRFAGFSRVSTINHNRAIEPDDLQLPVSMLEDIHENIKRLEDWRFCPVDVEIAIDKKASFTFCRSGPLLGYLVV